MLTQLFTTLGYANNIIRNYFLPYFDGPVDYNFMQCHGSVTALSLKQEKTQTRVTEL